MHFCLHALPVNFHVNCFTGRHNFPFVQIKQIWSLFPQLILQTRTNFVYIWHLTAYKKKRLPVRLCYKLLQLNIPVASYRICCQIARSAMKVYLIHNLYTSSTHTHNLRYIMYLIIYKQLFCLQIVSAHFLSLICITRYIHKTAHSIQRYMWTKLPIPIHPFCLYKFVLWHLAYFTACYREMAGDRDI